MHHANDSLSRPKPLERAAIMGSHSSTPKYSTSNIFCFLDYFAICSSEPPAARRPSSVYPPKAHHQTPFPPNRPLPYAKGYKIQPTSSIRRMRQ
ncbi:hypothetical protein VTJ04DRAFT_3287 [Mycothermus thermophilus]|uniref:uncharacterized protein n=1 Tax=Humicola insolens TaxID=85995 RepID=UPI0037424C16